MFTACIKSEISVKKGTAMDVRIFKKKKEMKNMAHAHTRTQIIRLSRLIRDIKKMDDTKKNRFNVYTKEEKSELCQTSL